MGEKQDGKLCVASISIHMRRYKADDIFKAAVEPI